MGKETIDQLAAKVVEALDGLDMTSALLQVATGLDEDDCHRTVNYLKSRGRIENVKGLIHLRPDESTTTVEPPIPSDTSPIPTYKIGGHTFYLPYHDLLPRLTDAEYEALKTDIQAHGIQVDVEVAEHRWDNIEDIPKDAPHYDVIDGGHRVKIAHELGLPSVPISLKNNNRPPAELLDLAWSLNTARRQISVEQRQAFAVKFRARGESLRSIAQKLNVGKSTVERDLAAAPAVPPGTGDTVTGLDGKSYPATKPDPTQQQRDAEALHAQFAGQTVAIGDIAAQSPIEWSRRVKATNLLTAQGIMTGGSKGVWTFAPLPEPVTPGPTLSAVEAIPGYAALHDTLADLKHPDVPDADAIAWTARELPTAQSEMLINVYQHQPVSRSAPVRIALINRKLLKPGDSSTAGGDWWATIEMTDKGRAVAEYLIDQAANLPPVSALASIESLPTAAQESTEPPAKSEAPALPPGVTFEQLHAPAHSDDHDPDLAAAILLRTQVDKATLDLLDAIQAFTRIRSIGGFVTLPRESLEATSLQLNTLQDQLRDTLTHADELNRRIVNLLNTGQPYDAEEGHHAEAH